MDDVICEFFPDIQELFIIYDRRLFCGLLNGFVRCEWSDRMTLCAGICYFYKKENLYCMIRLSRKLLCFRPFSDIINTLLHEMIHAYLFIFDDNLHKRESHGKDFIKWMTKINDSEGSNITARHGYVDEVENYRNHIWRCDGICRFLPPYYGYIKRSRNRPPQKSDFWWKAHEKECGGSFHKLRE